MASGSRDRNLPANLKLKAPGPTYDQEDMRQAFRALEQHYHIQLIPGTTGSSTTTPPPVDDGTLPFPARGLLARYIAGQGVTGTARPSSTADGYGALIADIPYTAATSMLDQSGNGHTLIDTGAATPPGPFAAASIMSPGGGNNRTMSCHISAGLSLSAATIYAVCRPLFAHSTQDSEFQLNDVFGIGTKFGVHAGAIGGIRYGAPTGDFALSSGWTGQTTDGTDYDIVLMTWDGATITAYLNGFNLPPESGPSIAMTGPCTVTDITTFNGQVQWTECGFFGVALTRTEIKQLFALMGSTYHIAVPL